MTAEYKMTLSPKTLDDAEPAARAVLERAQREVGFIPNMYAGMVTLPAVLETYLDGYGRFRRDTGFTPAEQEVVFLTISRVNRCAEPRPIEPVSDWQMLLNSWLMDRPYAMLPPVLQSVENRPCPQATRWLTITTMSSSLAPVAPGCDPPSASPRPG